MAGLDMSAYIPVDDTEAGPSTPEEEVSTQPRVLGSQESSPRAVIASQASSPPPLHGVSNPLLPFKPFGR